MEHLSNDSLWKEGPVGIEAYVFDKFCLFWLYHHHECRRTLPQLWGVKFIFLSMWQ